MIKQSLRALVRLLRKYCWHGQRSGGQRCLLPPGVQSVQEKTSTSPLFQRTRLTRSTHSDETETQRRGVHRHARLYSTRHLGLEARTTNCRCQESGDPQVVGLRFGNSVEKQDSKNARAEVIEETGCGPVTRGPPMTANNCQSALSKTASCRNHPTSIRLWSSGADVRSAFFARIKRDFTAPTVMPKVSATSRVEQSLAR